MLAVGPDEEEAVRDAELVRAAAHLGAEPPDRDLDEGVDARLVGEVRVGRAGDPDDETATTHDAERLRQRLAALRVEDEVDVREDLGEVLGGVVDDDVRAELPDEVGVLRARGRRDRGPEVLGQLDRHGAHATRAAVDQDGLAGLQVTHLDERLPRGQPHDGKGGSLGRRDGRRRLGQVALGRRDDLRVGAHPGLVGVAEDPGAGLEAGDVGPLRDDLAGELAAHDHRQLEGEDLAELAGPDALVGVVDARGGDPHEYFVGAGRGDRHVDAPHGGGVLLEDEGLHGDCLT